MSDLRSVRERVAALKSNLDRHKDEAEANILSPSVVHRSSPPLVTRALSSKDLSTLKTGKSSKELIPMVAGAAKPAGQAGAKAKPVVSAAAAKLGLDTFANRRKRAHGDHEGRTEDLEKFTAKLEKDSGASLRNTEEQIKALTSGLLKCGAEREQIERGNSREVEALREKLGGMLKTVSQSQAQSFEVLETMVDNRINDLREMLVQEKKAMLRRPPVPAHQKWREGASNNLRVTLQQYDAAMAFSSCKVVMQLTQKMNGLHEALLRERAAREEDEDMLQQTLDNMLQNAQRKLAVEREERTAMERELLARIQTTFSRYHTPAPPDPGPKAGQKSNRSRVG